jgi:hypothetical protein
MVSFEGVVPIRNASKTRRVAAPVSRKTGRNGRAPERVGLLVQKRRLAVNPAPRERGKRATIDRATGEVHGSGSGAGGNGSTGEDYDSQAYAGGGGDKAIGGPKAIDKAERRPHAEEGGDQ